MQPVSPAPTTVRSSCSYCGVGCGMVLQIETDPATGRRRVAKASGDKDHPTNRGRLCTKGATSAEMLAAPGRLERAQVRAGRDHARVEVPMPEAVAETARRLRAIVDEHGPDAVALYVSGQMSLEAQYLANKLAKGFLGTHRIESNSRLCMASAGTGYKLSLGADGPPGSYEDLDHADVFFVIGANMADCHPILFLRMMDRVKAGARLIVVDPRRTATADKADLFLQVRPGTDLALLNGLLHLLVADDRVDHSFVDEFTEGWEQMPGFLADYPPDVVARVTGISEDDLRTAAEWIGTAERWMSCWTMGLNQSTHGTWSTNALVNLHLATGAICEPGSGPFSLTGQPNAMGGREMGYMGPGLPGQRSVVDDDDRAFTEDAWGLPRGTLGTRVSAGTVDLFERMADGEVKAVWIIGTNPVASVGNRATVVRALERAELVIAQDVFADTETTAYADVLLPGTLWAESTYVTVSSDRTLTLLQQAADPVGDAAPDWRILADVACALGYADAFTYASSEEVFTELKRFWNPRTGWDLRGVGYDRLARGPVQWPSPPEDAGTPASAGDDGRHPIRYLNDGVSQRVVEREDGSRPRLAFATPSGRARFFARPHLDPAELPDDDRPFVLNTGRVQHQWHTMTKTGKVAKLNKLAPGPFVEVHPEDATRLGLSDGDRAEIASRRGRAVLPVRVSDRVQPGNLFAPFHWNDAFGEDLAVNAVTNDAVDPLSFQPELKVTAVSLTRVAAPADAEPAPVADLASPAAARPSAADDALLTGLGIVPARVPRLTTEQGLYVQGLLWARQQRPGSGAPVLPASAPFDAPTRAWLDGLLAGLFDDGATGPADRLATAPAPDTSAASPGVLVLWASQTGNAEDQAATVADRLRASGHAVRLVAMDEHDAASLPGDDVVLFVTSTFGDGEAPDNGEAFWAALAADDAPRLDGTRFAVLAFGDPSYSEFCGFGRCLDARLAALGAARLADVACCEPGDDAPADAWLAAVVSALEGPATGPGAAPRATVGAPGASAVVVRERGPAAAAEPAPRSHRDAPLTTRVTRNVRLGTPGSTKDVRQFGLAAEGLDYRAGDALSVRPRNSAAAVDAWLAATGLDGGTVVELEGVGPLTLRDACTTHLEIVNVTPDLLRFVQERAGDRELATLLRRDNRLSLERWLWGKHAVDVLATYPVRADTAAWLGVLKRLQPRLYSISSSPLAEPSEVHLTVSAVRYEYRGRSRHGVCSTFLADHSADADVPVFVQPTRHFRPPKSADAPMIMIGPGTGVAPFRGFLQERRALGHRGRNWLFFGERHSSTDFYYRDELEGMRDDRHLTQLSVAFSRDQRQKVYVQDRIREHGSQVWSWLEDGAHVYVCGDASRMAKDVDAALRDVARTWGALSDDAASAYLRTMAKEKRYVRDVY
ncbi:molybdopterin-dependent oxidoreductase [Luteimicrobium sp. DT211]|uniref:molybdopterin-dependent oxidoreductase n=1 Tax=Luteimicrobium sp. DT211 TaxID=3393412 RepID=UPI003CEB74E1